MESRLQDGGPEIVDDRIDEAFEFTRCFDEMRATLREIIGRSLMDTHDAEDALQETALRGWQYKDGLKRKQKFSGWICRIAKNVAVGFHRQRKRRLLLQVEFRNAAASAAPETDPQAPCRAGEIIESLPEHCRVIYVARFLFGYSNVELAKMFALHTNTIRNRLKEAETILEDKFRERSESATQQETNRWGKSEGVCT